MPEIDWSKFDGLSESICWCRCDWGKAAFPSHGKAVYSGEHAGLYSRKPCPWCGRTDNPYKIEGTPEEFIIRKDDVGEG